MQKSDRTLGKTILDASKFNIGDMMMEIAGITGKYMDGVEEQLLGTMISSYTTFHGDLDTFGSTRSQYITRYVDCNFHLVGWDQEIHESHVRVNKNRFETGKDSQTIVDDALFEENVEVMVPL